jgi:hypothetical protein
LEKIACGDFFETLHGRRRQKAWFLPPALSRSYARAGDFFDACSKMNAVPDEGTAFFIGRLSASIYFIKRSAICTAFSAAPFSS